MRDFRQLNVWQKAHELALLIYRQTSHFPAQERIGLGTNIRRAAVSMPMNIAQASGQTDRTEFANRMRTAIGISSELEYLLLLARDLDLVDSSFYDAARGSVVEIRKMLAGLSKTVAAQVRTEG